MPPARERVLVLCRAIPEPSKRYTRTVCVAGLTDGGEFRRIFPVPFKPYVPGGGIPFRKKMWIDAELLPADADHRRESRKIDLNSVRSGPSKIDDDDVRRQIAPHLAKNIASLTAAGDSLGIIKPDIVDYEIDVQSTDLTTNQLTLDVGDAGGRAGLVKLGQESHYKFNCPDTTGCSCAKQPHRLILLDWEVNELYRNIIKQGTTDPGAIAFKMREKFLTWMKHARDTYFMLGTHHVFQTWMIVSVLYLQPQTPVPPVSAEEIQE